MSKEKNNSDSQIRQNITDIFKKQQRDVVIPERAKLPRKTKKVKPTDTNSES